MPRQLWPWAIVLAVTLLAAPWLALQTAPAGDPLEREARSIERALRCPVCEGQSVADSNTAVALEMREEIRSLLAQGKTREQVLQHFVDRYGPWILFMPPRDGLFLFGWILPFLALAGGAWMIRTWLRTRGGRKDAAAGRGRAAESPAPAPDAAGGAHAAHGTPAQPGPAVDPRDWM